MGDASGRVEQMLREIQTEPWNEKGFPSVNLTYSEVLGRRVRSGDWADQRISTVQKIREALEGSDFNEAAALADFFVDEARVLYADIYRGWINDINEFLLARGVPYDGLQQANQKILSLLTLPDGRPFRARRLWEEFRSEVREFIRVCGAEKGYEARNLLERFHRSWLSMHDRDVDHIYGLMNEVVTRYGESALAEMWERISGGLFSFRYAKFDISEFDWKESLPTNLYLAFEAMRGHMVGPGREGNMEFSEDEDRFTFRFDPCGSGGHLLRGDQEVEGTPSRMRAPYNWGVLQQQHDFAWNKKGICYYCTNCAVIMQLKPIDAFGYPVRVVEPPTYPDQANAKCTWHIYKDPTAVPERYYAAVGRKKPTSFGSKRQAKKP
jgi:hypothetical protein